MQERSFSSVSTRPFPRSLAMLFAVTAGLAVGNAYAAQPLLDEIAAAFSLAPGMAGAIVTTTQVGLTAGLLLIVPLGDLVRRRRLVPLQLLVSAAALSLVAAASSTPLLLAAMAIVGASSVVAQVLVAYAAALAGGSDRGRAVGLVTSGIISGILLSRTVADALASFLGALHRPAPAVAPAGRHRRGGPLADSAAGFATMLDQATDRGLIADPDAVQAAWEDALAAPAWTGRPVWLHADLHPANVLTTDGSICGVIDFGDICAGDPACDLAGGWLLLPARAMDHFHRVYGPADAATLRRSRGWALLKALVCLLIGDNGAKGLPGGKPTWGPPAEAALLRLTRPRA